MYGASKDSVNAQKKFISRFNLTVGLISDVDNLLTSKYEVLKPKKLFGKDYMGIERSTFVFGEGLKILKEFRNVKVPGHAKSVLEEVEKLG